MYIILQGDKWVYMAAHFLRQLNEGLAAHHVNTMEGIKHHVNDRTHEVKSTTPVFLASLPSSVATLPWGLRDLTTTSIAATHAFRHPSTPQNATNDLDGVELLRMSIHIPPELVYMT